MANNTLEKLQSMAGDLKIDLGGAFIDIACMNVYMKSASQDGMSLHEFQSHDIYLVDTFYSDIQELIQDSRAYNLLNIKKFVLPDYELEMYKNDFLTVLDDCLKGLGFLYKKGDGFDLGLKSNELLFDIKLDEINLDLALSFDLKINLAVFDTGKFSFKLDEAETKTLDRARQLPVPKKVVDFIDAVNAVLESDEVFETKTKAET